MSVTYYEYCTKRKPYQELGHVLLLEMKHACLFYKPGKGKTYPTIDAIRDIDKNMYGQAKVLILSTANAINNMWYAEIVPQKILPKNTLLLSFTKAIQDKMQAELLSIKWDIVVVDESHHIKSHNSKISKLVYRLTKHSQYAFGLSGTPRGNSDIDIYCQFHNLNISDWGDISYTTFVDTCCEVDQRIFNGTMIKVPTKIKDKYRAGFERNIAMYTQRVEYDEDDSMPELNTNVVKIKFTPTKEYELAKQGVLQLTDYETTLTKLTVIAKLQQMANGFVYVTDEDDYRKRQTHVLSHNNKQDWLQNSLVQGERRIIVYRHSEEFNQIVDILSIRNVSWTDDFISYKTGKYDVLVLQCSQSESFNLQMCNRMTFYTMDYSYINYDQMLHRIYRLGQEKDLQIDILIAEGTVEEKIWKAVNHKQTLSDLFYSIKYEV